MKRMSVFPNERRRIYNLDYFFKGGVERRKAPWRLSPITDMRLDKDRRKAMHSLDYRGPERRSGLKRRSEIDRRKT